MKKLSLLFISLLLFSCGHKVMTMQAFYDIPTGTTVQELKQTAGRPYAIHKKDEVEEYEYVERFQNGNRTILERHYFFIVKENQVIQKRVEQINPPPYSINSYDLQTTYSEEDEPTREQD
ncbi:MAG: hypothetical protein PVI40_01280 [Chlamydiota bacterium]|jgi:hypothetical protein